ncbi:Dicer-like protein 4 [Sesamum angolense]|uniref:Dicer-like protein 4 n=1 Tax=Sesamum angolense TaxID=2727404 RepID=A0AAE1VY05_9LAMI|nr:Dicer-like protein 4 [Sesamum angolense]
MDGDNTTTVQPSESVENGICNQLSTLSLNGDEERLITETPAKDPRRITGHVEYVNLPFISVLVRYFNPKPQFCYCDDADGIVCNIILPANAPIHQIVSSPKPSTKAAKKDACLKACKALHDVGALTDYLLPEQDVKYDKLTEELSDSDGRDEESRALYEMLVPAALRKPWQEVGNSTYFCSYYIEFCPNPADRTYRGFGLFMKEPLPEEAGKMKVDLCLARGRMVMTQLIPSGTTRFDKDEIAKAEMFQQMFLKIIFDRHLFKPEYVSLENNDVYELSTSTFYLLLPVIHHEDDKISVDWTLVNRCLSSPIFRHPGIGGGEETSQAKNYLHLDNGQKSVHDIVNSLVYVSCKGTFFFISDILLEKSGYSLYNDSKSHVEPFDIHLSFPDQPLLKAKQLFNLENLLRKKKHSEEWREKEEHFIELRPEICQLKVIGFSKDIGSSLSLLPSILHRLESFLVAIELKEKLVASFPEGAEVTAQHILEALTTERCYEHFSLERLEVLGDAFLKFAVGRHLFLKHDALDEGQLTRKRSNIVSNSNLLKLATRNNLQVYIRDQSFVADQFFAFGRSCSLSCNKETEKAIHPRSYDKKNSANAEVRCNKCHHWLHNKTVADVVEALVGAFIVDSGFKAATAFLNWLGIEVDFTPLQIDNICSSSKAFLPLVDQMYVNALENLLGYKFAHKGLLIQAFVHPSFNNHLGGCYQRLEFLGDAVFDYLITSYLYSVYPNLKPGQLTDLRSVLVNNTSFADVAGRWSFHKFIICDSSVLHETMTKYVNSTGSSTTGKGHIEEKTCPNSYFLLDLSALGDLVESCMGAIFLDTGFDLNHVWKIMLSLLDPIISFSKLQMSPLRELHELCQSYNWEVQFSSPKRDGKFEVEAKVNKGKVSATASATNISRKVARKIAARQLCECLKAQGYKSKTKSLEEVLRESKKMEAQLIDLMRHHVMELLNLVLLPLRRQNQVSIKYALLTAGNHLFLNVVRRRDQATWKFLLNHISVSNLNSGPVCSCRFSFKIVMEIKELPNQIFEFYGEPRMRKKDAAEHAAQGALWYIKQEGYV